MPQKHMRHLMPHYEGYLINIVKGLTYSYVENDVAAWHRECIHDLLIGHMHMPFLPIRNVILLQNLLQDIVEENFDLAALQQSWIATFFDTGLKELLSYVPLVLGTKQIILVLVIVRIAIEAVKIKCRWQRSEFGHADPPRTTRHLGILVDGPLFHSPVT